MAQRSFRTFLKLVSAPLWLCVAVFSLHAGAATLNVTSLAETGAGTLRDQVAAAAANDTVAFTVTGTIILASPIVISRALFIAGPGNGTVVITRNKIGRAHV